jgi:hypothetical protein
MNGCMVTYVYVHVVTRDQCIPASVSVCSSLAGPAIRTEAIVQSVQEKEAYVRMRMFR